MSEIEFTPVPTNPKFKDLTGQVFSMLTVLGFAGRRESRCLWHCMCDCGNVRKVLGYNLKNRNSESCGCLHPVRVRAAIGTHGASESLAYSAWEHMWSRCTNSNVDGYEIYKDRCPPDSWRDFSVFLADVGPRPEGLSLDRIDNDKPYGPGNCRWVSMKVQQNNRSNNVRLTYDGETLSVAQWADKLKVKAPTIYYRLSRGWSVERALTQPVR